MKKDLILILLLLILVLSWFGNVIFEDNIFCFGDIPRYYYPLRGFAREMIREGKFPLWNPYILCGNPLFATLQSQVLYPISVIYYVFSMAKGFVFYTVLHFVLAGIFLYILLRSWKLSRYACFIAALVYVFNGFIICSIYMNTTLSSIIWLPIIIYFFEKAVRHKSFSYTLIAGLFLGIQFLGGEPTPLTYTIYLLFFYGLWMAKRDAENVRGYLRILYIFVGTCVFSFLFVAVQALPFMEFVMTTTKLSISTFDNASKWSLQPKELLNFFVPFTFGNITRPGEAFGSQLWLASNYMGILTIFLAILAVFNFKNKRMRFWSYVLLISIIMALGKFTPVYKIIYKIFPLVKYNRYPVKYLSLTVFCVAVLAGFGYEKLLSRDVREKILSKSLLWLNVLMGFFVVLATVYWKPFFINIVKTKYSQGIDQWQLEKLSDVFTRNLMYVYQDMIIFFAGTFLVLMWLKNKNVRAWLFNALFVSLVLIDLANANQEISKVAPIDVLNSRTENIEYIKKDESMFRIHRSKVMDDFNNVVYGDNYVEGLQDRKDSFTANTIMRYKIYDTGGYDSVVREDIQNVIVFINTRKTVDDTKLLNMLNVKYLITASPIEAEGYKLIKKKELRPGQVCMTENKNVLPRFFLVDKYTIAKDRNEALAHICRADFDPAKEVITEKQPVFKEEGNPSGKQTVDLIKYMPGEAVVEAILKKQKILVFGESWYPGWKVFIDGNSAELYRLNYMLMGVPLGTGKHEVMFKYEPVSFKIGVLVSSSTCLLVFLYFCVFYGKKIKHKRA